MTWTNANKVIVGTEIVDGKLVPKKKDLTQEQIQSIKHVAIDVMALLHRGFQQAIKNLCVFTKAGAVIKLVHFVLSQCESYFTVMLSLESITLVIDGPVSEIKKRQTEIRYGVASQKRAEGKERVQQLIEMIIDDNNEIGSNRAALEAEALKLMMEGQTLSLIISDIKMYLLHTISKRTSEQKKIRLLFAPHDAEAVLASFSRDFPSLVIFCRDYDLFSHGCSRFITEYKVSNSLFVASYVERADAFRIDFKPYCMKESGLFHPETPVSSLLLVFLHVLMGSDYFSFGNDRGNSGLAGLGAVNGIKLICEMKKDMEEIELTDLDEVFKFCCRAVFHSTQWEKQVLKTSAQINEQKKQEFISAVAYFYYGESIVLTKINSELEVCDLTPNNCHIYGGYVSPPLKHFISPLPVVNPFDDELFFGINLMNDPKFLKFDEKQFFACCDVDYDVLFSIFNREVIEYVCKLYGCSPLNATRSELHEIIKSRRREQVQMDSSKVENGVEISIPFKELGEIHSQDANSTLNFFRTMNNFSIVNKLHRDFQRAGIPESNFSETDAQRALKLAFGHIVLKRFQVFLNSTIENQGVEEERIVIIVSGLIPSLKNGAYYCYISLFKEAVSLATDWWDKRGSYCTCVAGRSNCSHQRGVILFIGAISCLLSRYAENDAVLSQLPDDIMEVQAKPRTFLSAFSEQNEDNREEEEGVNNNFEESESEDEIETNISSNEFHDGEINEIKINYSGNIAENIASSFLEEVKLAGYPANYTKGNAVFKTSMNILNSPEQINLIKRASQRFLHLLVRTGGASIVRENRTQHSNNN